MIIKTVMPQGIGYELGLKSGDRIVAFDSNPVVDVLDYEFYDSLSYFVLTAVCNGEEIDFEIDKDDDESLGLVLEDAGTTKVCVNKCLFCFCDNLPPNSRATLRIKDDDYRTSFLLGNYITLTNLTDSDFDRILRLRLSPLYISVHSTDDVVRRRLIGNPKAKPILPQLKRLSDEGIVLHTQIVYCPTYNDDYVTTARELSAFAETLAIVPVGLTAYSNPGLVPVDNGIAAKIIADVRILQKEFLLSIGRRFVYAADEFFVRAGISIPSYEEYDDFEQIENGVGLLAKFEHEALSVPISNIGCKADIQTVVATSIAAYDTIKRIVEAIGVKCKVIPIPNKHFGGGVSVAGLVCGSDIVSELKGLSIDRLLIPSCMLKEGETIFLDDMTLSELKAHLDANIIVVPVLGDVFVSTLMGNQE